MGGQRYEVVGLTKVLTRATTTTKAMATAKDMATDTMTNSALVTAKVTREFSIFN